MTQIPISEWKKVPERAQIRQLILGKLRRNVDSPLKALSEFCHCASVLAGQRLRTVMRSGKFKGWLGYSGINLEMPVCCSVGIYISSNRMMSTNLMRICLLAEAIGISSGCYLLYDESKPDEVGHLTFGPKKPFHRIDDQEICALKPMAIVLGTRRIVVKSWNDCLPKYVKYVKTSVPFGEKIAPAIPSGYEHYDSVRCVKAMRVLIEASGLDRYSVFLEYSTGVQPQRADEESQAENDVKSRENDVRVMRVETSVPRGRHHRRFLPAVAIW